MRKTILSLLVLLLFQAGLTAAAPAVGQTAGRGGEYTLVIEGYDWERESARSSSR